MGITNRKSLIVDDDFMEATFDQSTSDVFKLLSSLHEKIIPRRDFDSNALPVAGIPDPDIQTWITRTTVNSQKIDIWVISYWDCTLLAIFYKVSWTQWELISVICLNDISK